MATARGALRLRRSTWPPRCARLEIVDGLGHIPTEPQWKLIGELVATFLSGGSPTRR